MSMDEQHVTLFVLLDLSAAFDTIYHDKLIGRLESDLGITDNTLAYGLNRIYLTGFSVSL